MTFPMAGGVGLATRNPDGSGLNGVDYFGPLLKQAAQDAWAEYRPRLIDHLHQQLGRADLIRSGFTLYELDIRISPDLDLTAERDGNGDLVVTLTTGGNYIEATTTVPSVLGSYADPRFSLAFGLELSYRIDLPPVTQPLAATGFQSIRVLAPKADSQNLPGDLVFFLSDVAKWFVGLDCIAMLEQFIATTDFASYANSALAPLNAKLTELASQGYWYLEQVIDTLDGSSDQLHGLSLPGAPADRLELLLTAYGLDTSGVIEGEVHWPRSLGEPTNRPRGERLLGRLHDFNVATTSALINASPGDWADVREAAADRVVLAGAPGPAPVADKLQGLTPEEAASTAVAIRSAAATSFRALMGDELFLVMRDEFLHGRSDLEFSVTTPVGGVGLFPEMRPVGRLASLWEADDETMCRRRFTIVDVPTEVPLTVTCDLADGYRWDGPNESVTISNDGWIGTVTVRKVDRVLHDRVFDDQVELVVQGRRRFGARTELEEAGIIVIGGLGDEVALNPQPLPPRGDKVALNPQPLPPGGLGQLVRDQLVVERVRQPALDVGLRQIDAELLVRDRENPSGQGTVTGIDFEVAEYVYNGPR